MTRKKKQLLCEENLRHNEYYGMQDTFDNLYAASKNGEVFTDLMSIVLQRENILLAYRNIKKNTGSKTCGTDELTIRDIGKCSPDEVVEKSGWVYYASPHRFCSNQPIYIDRSFFRHVLYRHDNRLYFLRHRKK